MSDIKSNKAITKTLGLAQGKYSIVKVQYPFPPATDLSLSHRSQGNPFTTYITAYVMAVGLIPRLTSFLVFEVDFDVQWLPVLPSLTGGSVSMAGDIQHFMGCCGVHHQIHSKGYPCDGGKMLCSATSLYGFPTSSLLSYVCTCLG